MFLLYGVHPKPKKDGFNKVRKIEGDTIMTHEGFVTPGSILLGEEGDILEALRKCGLSEEALTALKQGKIVRQEKLELPDGQEVILGEDWRGKKAEEGH